MSDPSVQNMTYAQWLFEYYALRKKDESLTEYVSEALKSLVSAFREVLIGVLGLNLLKKWNTDDPKVIKHLEGMTPFVPASFLFSQPEILKGILDEQKKEDDAEAAMADTAFDEFSKKLARGDIGDMDPMILGKPGDEKPYWQSEAAKQALAALGVKPRASTHTVPHNTARPRNMIKHSGPIVIIDEGDDG